MGDYWQIRTWPAPLEDQRVGALTTARVALAAVDAALAGRLAPDCVHEAGARARCAFRAAQSLVLAARELQLPPGERWPTRSAAQRRLIEQNADAGVDLVGGLASAGGLEQRRLLLDLLSLLSDLAYFLDVLGRRRGASK